MISFPEPEGIFPNAKITPIIEIKNCNNVVAAWEYGQTIPVYNEALKEDLNKWSFFDLNSLLIFFSH